MDKMDTLLPVKRRKLLEGKRKTKQFVELEEIVETLRERLESAFR